MSSAQSGSSKDRRAAIGPGKKRHHGAWWTAGILLFFLLMAGIVYGADLMMNQGRVPRGVTVGGVNIGGMSHKGAEKTLRDQLGDRVRTPVTVKAGDMESRLDPTMSGLRVDWEQTVENAGQQPLNPWTRLESFWKTREVGIANDVDESTLDNALTRVDRELHRNPVNAELAIGDDGKAQVTEPVMGQDVDPEVLSTLVSRNWLNTSGVVVVPADTLEPDVGEDALHKAERDVLNKVVSGPLTLKGRDDVKAEIKPEQMGQVVTFRADNGQFVPEYHPDAAQSIASVQLSSTERPLKNASISVSDSGAVTVTAPSSDGVKINWDETLKDLDKKLTNTTVRTYDVAYDEEKAKFTTEMAQRADFSGTMGSFTTGGFSSDSGVNIRRVAQMVDGAVVAPGETFSLNGYTGPRGTAQGFVEAGVIKDGHSSKAVGGGISQFATTLYNATYFAGMDDVSHTPHSYYISRYPAGREATVYEGAIDLKFKNPFDIPVLIRAKADSSQVSVEIRGVPQVHVESITGPKTNYTDPKEITLPKDGCTPSSGSRGFTVTDTRVVTSLADNREISRKTTTTVYDPEPKVKCS